MENTKEQQDMTDLSCTPAEFRGVENTKEQQGKTGTCTSAEIDSIFENLLSEVGTYGRFQKTFLFIFSFLDSIFVGMAYLNIMLAMSVPDHWCHVPGQEATNDSIGLWKNKTIPRNGLNNGYSKCEMYHFNLNDDNLETEPHPNITTNCSNGWDFDETWYSSTVPSQEELVCDKSIIASNILAGSCVGYVLGGFVGGQMSDMIGRKPVYLMTLVGLLVGRCLFALSSGDQWLFILSAMLGNMSLVANYHTVLTAGVELMPKDKKQLINIVMFTGWTLGHMLMPLIAWIFGNWQLFTLASTCPALLIFFFLHFFPESPRWLATKGKSKYCVAVLNRIAKINGTKLSDQAKAKSDLERISTVKETVYGIASLFSSWRLARNTICLCISWIANFLIYYVVVLHMSNMSGNPFVNYTLQGIIELPGNVIALWFCKRFGRRWVHTGFFLLEVPIYIALAIFAKENTIEWLPSFLLIVVKFNTTITYYVVYLQAMEIFPTCVRQSGTGLASVLGSSVTTVGPYIIYLGTNVDPTAPYVILTGLALLGTLSTSFMPETLNYQLPETLLDAKTFGKEQRYWSLPPRNKVEKQTCTSNVINK